MDCVVKVGRSFRDDVVQPLADAVRMATGAGCFGLAGAFLVLAVALDWIDGSMAAETHPPSVQGLYMLFWAVSLAQACELARFEWKSIGRRRHPYFGSDWWLLTITLTFAICAVSWIVRGRPYGQAEAAVYVASNAAWIFGAFLASCERRDFERPPVAAPNPT